MPGFVDEMGVGADRVDLHTEFLECLILLGHVFQLGGAYKGEVGRVEKEDGPFAEDIFVGDGLELSVVIGLNFEFRNVGVDN